MFCVFNIVPEILDLGRNITNLIYIFLISGNVMNVQEKALVLVLVLVLVFMVGSRVTYHLLL
jgi:hypothetical protein